MRLIQHFIIGLALMAVLGCTSKVPFPTTIQNGGSLVVSLADRNFGTGNQIPRASEFSASITDTNHETQTITVRMLFPVRPDATAAMAENTVGYGFYMMVADLLDPNSGAPTTLSTGEGTLEITNTQGIAGLVNLTMPVTILDGIGEISPVSPIGDAKFAELMEPREQLRVIIADPGEEVASDSPLGGITLTFSYPAAAVNGVDAQLWPRVISTVPDSNVSYLSRTLEEGENKQLIVDIVNPYGIANVAFDRALREIGEEQMSNFEALEFSVSMDAGSPVTASDISLVDVAYVNIDGESVNPAVSVNTY